MKSHLNISDPLVSVVCITFNHVDYIKRALESIVIQNVNFPYEIIVHDDASEDGTVDVIKSFEQEFPHLFNNILQNENQFSKGRKPIEFWKHKVRGKYIAICEGDDYWIDPLKLQKQVAILEYDTTISVVSHACRIEKLNSTYIYRLSNQRIFDFSEYLIHQPYCATASLMFRSEVLLLFEDWMKTLFAGDITLKYLALLKGNMMFLNDVMCVYNKGIDGSWTSRKLNLRVIRKEYSDNIKLLNYVKNIESGNISNYASRRKRKTLFYRSLKKFKAYILNYFNHV